MGKILRVDLSKNKITDEDLPSEDVMRKYVGGSGLGLKYLFDEVPPTINPLDPESRLIFMTGPLSGTVWPCSSRHAIVNLDSGFHKSPGNSWGGGFWAAKLRWAGYDGLIVQGKSSGPVYLLLQDGKPMLREASHLWGKETLDTENLIRKELGDPQCSAVCIGPAGERCLPASIILNDQHHAACKGGAGQLMGSKQLKAIAISGRPGNTVPLADIKNLTELALEYRKLIVESPVMGVLSHGGLSTHYDVWPFSMLTWKNLSEEDGEEAAKEWAKQFMDVVRESEVVIRPCFNCPIACHQQIKVGKGPYKDYISSYSGGGGWEGIACRIGVLEGSTSIYLTHLAQRLGTDTAITGGKMGLLYECYEKGLIDKKFADGLELNWGNVDSAIKLLYKFVNQEGIGKLLAEDQDEIARTIGHGAEEFLEGAKGMSMHHDFRESWEFILAHALATCGISPDGFGVDAFFPAMAEEFGYPVGLPRFDKDRAPTAVRLTAMKNRWDNVLGICQFSVYATYPSMDYELKALKYAVGWDFDREEAYLVAERMMNLAHIFALRRGFSIKDDLHVGARLLDGHKVGEYKDNPIRPHFNKLVKNYYGEMGWDRDTGIPLDNTLMKLGLDDLIKEVTELRSLSKYTPIRHKVKGKPVKTNSGQ
jgi:aldehyde:ferredoxin oxidoreductase